MKKRNIVPIITLALAVGAGALFITQRAPHATFVPYKDFYALVENDRIASARIDGERIYFRVAPAAITKPAPAATDELAATGAPAAALTDHAVPTTADSASASNFPSYTQNPYSPTLYEQLLLHGAEVTVATDGAGIFSSILDVLFYAIFFGALIIVFRKFISPNTFKVVRRTGVTFDDVVGMDELKAYMKQVMEIMRQPAEYAKRGVRAPKGVLLCGAPGNGKTLFARALAGEAKVNFIPAKATDFESMFMAIGPMKVKLLFRKARKRAPCIVFIDEFDGIGTRRNYTGSAIETENTRIVTALLNELDGFQANSGILVLAATNSIAALDEALIRPGRFDLRVQVTYPDAAAREQLVRMYLRGKTFAAGAGNAASGATGSERAAKTGSARSTEPAAAFVRELVRRFDGKSAAEIESALNDAVLTAAQAGRAAFTLSDIRV